MAAKDHRVNEKAFIQECYAERVFQKASESGKVICPDCYANENHINFFTEAGVHYHYRRFHKRTTFDADKALSLFKDLHFGESKRFLRQLMDFRVDGLSQ